MKPTTAAFHAGIVVTASMHALRQDWYGLEGYVAQCREHWLDATTTVPIAIALLSGAIILYGWAANREMVRSALISAMSDALKERKP